MADDQAADQRFQTESGEGVEEKYAVSAPAPSPLRVGRAELAQGSAVGVHRLMTDMIESDAMMDGQREFARQMRAQPTDAESLTLPGRGCSRSERGGVADDQAADQRFQTETAKALRENTTTPRCIVAASSTDRDKREVTSEDRSPIGPDIADFACLKKRLSLRSMARNTEMMSIAAAMKSERAG